MEVDAETLDNIFTIFTLFCGVLVGSIILSLILRHLVYAALIVVIASAIAFTLERYTDITVFAMYATQLWGYISLAFSIIVKFFLDIYKSLGIMSILAIILGAAIGLKGFK